MLLTVAECLSQSKWILFRKKPRKLFDFYSIDAASRGPLGSLNWLHNLSGFTFLAYVGAILTILSTVLGPFTQQVVTYPLRSVVVSEQSVTVPRVQSWNAAAEDGLDGMYICDRMLWSYMEKPFVDRLPQWGTICWTLYCYRQHAQPWYKERIVQNIFKSYRQQLYP